MTPSANWSFPTPIRFGAGRIVELTEACSSLGIKRPLLVTDRGLASLPITAQTLDILESGGFERALFAEVDPNQNEKNLAEGLAAYAAGNHDGIIAYTDGTNIAARSQMLVAATMGATAFMKGLGAIHALSHPIGAHHNTHHGTTNAVVMPRSVRFAGMFSAAFRSPTKE